MEQQEAIWVIVASGTQKYLGCLQEAFSVAQCREYLAGPQNPFLVLKEFYVLIEQFVQKNTPQGPSLAAQVMLMPPGQIIHTENAKLHLRPDAVIFLDELHPYDAKRYRDNIQQVRDMLVATRLQESGITTAHPSDVARILKG